METERINLLFGNPSEASEDDVSIVENEILKYPYFQGLHILLAKIHFLLNTKEKNKKLTLAAIYSSERSILKKVILEKDYLQKPEVVIPYQELPEFELEKLNDNNVSIEPEQYDSSSIFDEVLMNLEKLKALRQQFQFLELNQPDDKTKKTPRKIKNKLGRPKSKKQKGKKSTKEKPESKQEKLNKILEKDEILDSQVNTFFLSEIEKSKESIVHKKSSIKATQSKIIEKFIEEQPSIGSANKESIKSSDEENKDLSEKSTNFGDDLVSENLAIILLKQGKKERAVDIYKKLIWKSPQKKAYFAARIEEIKK